MHHDNKNHLLSVNTTVMGIQHLSTTTVHATLPFFPFQNNLQFREDFIPDREGSMPYNFEYYTVILRSESDDIFTSV